MLNPTEKACLQACNDCAAACLQCAAGCLRESNPKPMVRCIELDMECADICRMASAAIARAGELAKDTCRLCAQSCETCEAECARHDMDHCRRCAEACRVCAQACRGMAG